MQTFKRLDHTAVISGPVYGFSTHFQKTKEGARGTRVTLYRVDIDGQPAYHAPTKDLCREWLIRQGFMPS